MFGTGDSGWDDSRSSSPTLEERAESLEIFCDGINYLMQSICDYARKYPLHTAAIVLGSAAIFDGYKGLAYSKSLGNFALGIFQAYSGTAPTR